MTYRIKVGNVISKIENETEKFKVYMISESYLGIMYHLINLDNQTALNIKKEDLKDWKKETI
jgi:hypothetical protein